jgi:NADH dehydrogenase
VASIGSVKLWGWPAWLAWLMIHIFFLIGFRNRIVVLIDWAVAYMTYQRHARILTGPPPVLAPRAGVTHPQPVTHEGLAGRDPS